MKAISKDKFLPAGKTREPFTFRDLIGFGVKAVIIVLCFSFIYYRAFHHYFIDEPQPHETNHAESKIGLDI